VKKRSVVIAGHRTSVSLEDPFWAELKRMAASEGKSLGQMIEAVDATRDSENLSSALRIAVLAHVQREAGREPA